MDYFSIATMDYFSIGIYNVIRSLTDNCNDKKERSDNEIAPLSHLVEERRLERPTPTSRTWCATNCATPRAMLTTDLH